VGSSAEATVRPTIKFKSVRTKLLAAFGAVCVLLAIVGWLGIQQQSTLAHNATQMYNQNLVPATQLADSRTGVAQAHKAVLNSIIATDASEKSDFANDYNAAVATVNAAQKKYQASDMTGREQDRNAFNKAWATYLNIVRTQVQPLIARTDSGRLADFMKVRNATLEPEYDAVMTPLDGLTQIEQKDASALEAAGRNSANSARTFTIALVLFGVGAAFGLGLFLARTISRPLGQSVESLDALANKDLTRSLDIDTVDETGRMATSLNGAIEGLRQAMGTIDSNAAGLAAAAEELSAISTQIGANSEETSAQSNMVAAASEQVTQNVSTVASAVEEMTASIAEISKSASEATSVAAQAVEIANDTNTNVQQLGESSAEIGNVVKLITAIAEQTNLLALNATIEAARAGDAGKGFAVVASEVKDLATETAKATDEISRRIDEVQRDTASAVQSIAKITEIIARINDIQTGIAGAVEQQAATTSEIGRSVDEAAKGVNDITENITAVASAAQDTARGVSSSNDAVRELNQMANSLKELVGEFQY
jgi:methyl-accepting chemotaxis protein